MSFQVIETQEQFDEAIKERIARVEKQTKEATEKELANKYSDYEQIKNKNTELTDSIAKFKEKENELQMKLNENSTLIESLKVDAKKYETNSAKMEIALQKGLPYEFAKRLNGDTIEEIEKDADSLLSFVGKPISASFTNEPITSGFDDKHEAIKSLVQKMNNKD